MKKIISVMLALLMLAAAGCTVTQNNRPVGSQGAKTVDDVLNERINESKQTTGTEPEQKGTDTLSDSQPADTSSVDVDLTKLNSTMVYSEVYNMMSSPENYLGKRVRMNGSFAYAQGDNRYYFACIIADATACCSQGIEFTLSDDRKFPDEYPKKGKNITVVGIFDTYYEGARRYCQLINAVME